MKRRPSFAAVVALLALFVALGGPAEAQRLLGKGSVTSRAVKDRSLKVQDLSRKTVRELRATPNSSITEAKLANGSVTPGKLAPASVGTAAIADNSVAGADIANGSLTALPTSAASGALPDRRPGRGAGHVLVGRADRARPELAGADISQDIVLVTPTRAGRRSGCRSPCATPRTRCGSCSPAATARWKTVQPFEVAFRYESSTCRSAPRAIAAPSCSADGRRPRICAEFDRSRIGPSAATTQWRAPTMPNGMRWVGLDVHAHASAVAVFDDVTGEVITAASTADRSRCSTCCASCRGRCGRSMRRARPAMGWCGGRGRRGSRWRSARRATSSVGRVIGSRPTSATRSASRGCSPRAICGWCGCPAKSTSSCVTWCAVARICART